MLRIACAALLLAACNRDRPLATDRCTTSIEALCASQHCPLSKSDWCAGGQPAPFYGWNGAATCNGWSLVVEPALDQPTHYFYDAAGKLVAILAAESDPPCLGACRWVCLAGPPDVGAGELMACEGAVDPNHCGGYTIDVGDAGLVLSPADGGTR